MRKCREAAFVSTEGDQIHAPERPERNERLIGRQSCAFLAKSPQFRVTREQKSQVSFEWV
jgi:hypothetical protein